MTAHGASASASTSAADSNTLSRPHSAGRQRKQKIRQAEIIARPPSRNTLRAARFALFFTGIAWLAYVVEQVIRLNQSGLGLRGTIETAVYLVVVCFLTLSASAYLLTRIGYYERIAAHRRVPRATIDDFFDTKEPSLTVLIPSYREDERVLRQTLFSAALQEYPNLRVVLLLDDPPTSSDPEHRRALERARAVPGLVEASLKEPHAYFEKALREFEARDNDDGVASAEMLHLVADHYFTASNWLRAEEANFPRLDHTDDFLKEEVFERTVEDLRRTSTAIRAAAMEAPGTTSKRRVHQLYRRLERLFNASVVSFERKQYASLSHEANKAMNLNSYLGLMGGEYSVVSSPGGAVLLPTTDPNPDLVIPDSDYVLTLDADSMLLPEYCLRLVYFLEQEENSRVAVAQTPYSAYQGAKSPIERIAGATTDVQHVVHQGLTSFGATFWVGANAVIRKSALKDIEQCDEEDGFMIKRFVQDRTVIEDTESSIDLRAKDWQLYNYPERLSYSATPPDFGSLVIQRRRWANGGLVIFPKLLRLKFRRAKDGPRISWAEFFLRSNYLISISWASLGLLMLLFYPFDERLLSRFAAVTALPYFWAMSTDLKNAGYRRLDVLGVYGFNLLLLPVNLVGTFQSIVQGIGAQKIAFARTPKVRNHTVAPLLFVALPLFLIAWSGRTLALDIEHEFWVHGAFAGVNLVMTTYACVALVGIPSILIDIFMSFREFVYRPVTPQEQGTEVPYWASVLYVGASVPEEIERSGAVAVALAAEDRFTAERAQMSEA